MVKVNRVKCVFVWYRKRHLNLATDLLQGFTSIFLYIEPQTGQGKHILLSSLQMRWTNILKKDAKSKLHVKRKIIRSNGANSYVW